MRLKDRVAIVTGAGGGMGAATAERLAVEGARVLAVDLPDKAQPSYASADRIRFFGADLRREDDLRAIVAAAQSTFGRIDILVNNAGVVGTMETDPLASDENWHFVLSVNLEAVRKLTREVLPDLKQSGHGRIINLGSVASEYPSRGFAPAYDVSKHAVYGLTKSLAMNLGAFGITVNAILPGATDTPMTRTYPSFEQFEKFGKERSPLGRLGTPQDIAAAVAYLASDDASFVTGHGLFVDGGIHLNV